MYKTEERDNLAQCNRHSLNKQRSNKKEPRRQITCNFETIQNRIVANLYVCAASTDSQGL